MANRVSTTLVSADLVPAIHILQARTNKGGRDDALLEEVMVVLFLKVLKVKKVILNECFYFIKYSSYELRKYFY